MPNFDLVKIVVIVLLLVTVLALVGAFITLGQTVLGEGSEYIEMSMTQVADENQAHTTGREFVSEISGAFVGWDGAMPGGLFGLLIPVGGAIITVVLGVFAFGWLRRVLT